MRRGLALWLICFSLIGARVLGLHLHVCDGIESGIQHAGAHLADNGMLFGEHHSDDDGDDREVEVAAVVASKLPIQAPDLGLPAPAQLTVEPLVTQLLTTLSPRGPPQSRDTVRSHFTPPLRGPPSYLA